MAETAINQGKRQGEPMHKRRAYHEKLSERKNPSDARYSAQQRCWRDCILAGLLVAVLGVVISGKALAADRPAQMPQASTGDQTSPLSQDQKFRRDGLPYYFCADDEAQVQRGKQTKPRMQSAKAEPSQGAKPFEPVFIGAPCPDPPVDVPEFDASFIYRFVGFDAQLPFDRFSWQSFIAANWPMNDRHQPVRDGYRHPQQGMLRWQSFAPKDHVVFTRDIEKENVSACATDDESDPGDTGADTPIILHAFRQPTGEVLVDQAGNYVLYQTRINKAAASYLATHGLETPAGRKAFAQTGEAIAFPQIEPAMAGGKDPVVTKAKHGSPGALLVKMAWRVLPKDADQNRFLTRPARIAVAAEDAVDGKPACHDVTVGLVGMHLVQRVISGNGDRWIWSTFEHVDNAPLAANARGANSFISPNLFPKGCFAPKSADLPSPGPFQFFSDHQQGAMVNQAPVEAAYWGDQPPFARNHAGVPLSPAQLVRCWKPFDGTMKTNVVWHRKLAGTVWQNYFLVGTQWVGNIGGGTFGVGEVPRYLSNVVLESFIQDSTEGTCLGCHAGARSDAGQPSNFTFLLSPTN